MRLCRLDLLRYGHLSGVSLDFPRAAALHLVLGANEAGKSTSLSAIADALFGFGHRSDHGFLHGMTNLRVGFTLARRDGTEARFIRRKGRQGTLLDAAGEPLPDDALLPFLGGANREVFEQGFGLDGTRLREGGRKLLEAGGEAGESLLAGVGLLHVRKVLDQVEEAAKALVGDGRGRRALSDAANAWRAAQAAMQEKAIAHRDWEQAQQAADQAAQALQKVQRDSAELAAEERRLQMVRRVAPILAQLDDARATKAALSDAPAFHADDLPKMRDALAAREQARRDIARETERIGKLAAQVAALPRDEAILFVQDAVDALAAKRAQIAQAEADLLAVSAEAARRRAEVQTAIAALGIALSPEQALEALPSQAARGSLERLIRDHARLETTLQTHEAGLRAAERRHDEAARKLAGTPQVAPPLLLRQTLDAVRAEAHVETALAGARQDCLAAEREADAALAALPLWRGALDALATCPVPLEADCAAAAERLATAQSALAEARKTEADLGEQIREAEDQIHLLARGETVPTPAAVAEARRLRDAAWLDYRARPGDTLAAKFEALRDEADRLSDRRAEDAQRVADYLAATARLVRLRERREQAAARAAGLAEALAEAEARWAALWEKAGVVPGTPAAMQDWRRRREEILRLEKAAAEARRNAEDLAARRDRALAALAPLLPKPDGAEDLASLIRRAEIACKTAEAAQASREKLQETLEREAAQVAEQAELRAAACDALAAWEGKWKPALAAIGLGPDAPVGAAQSAVAAWQTIAELAPLWAEAKRRISAMRDAIAAFADAARGLRETLQEDLTDGEPAITTSARLARRLGAARTTANQADNLRRQIAERESDRHEAEHRAREADAVLEAMRARARAPDDAALEAAIQRAIARDKAIAAEQHLHAELLAQGDGMDEAGLRQAVAALDPAAAAARLEEVAQLRRERGDARERLSAERTRAEAALAEMERATNAAHHAQEAADALARAREAAERYARLHVARVLLRAGIERFRAQQQGPMLRAASEHFRLLTGGRYARLRAEEDADGKAQLLAVGAQGMECPIAALSEGTRDQLYLALRVAAIEEQARGGLALPFIGDDLLVNFDDVRAAAAIRLLVRLGEVTQVILFTHHAHLARLAAAEPGVAVHELSPMLEAA